MSTLPGVRRLPKSPALLEALDFMGNYSHDEFFCMAKIPKPCIFEGLNPEKFTCVTLHV
ncbi:MAG: hypothetical protein ABJA84_10520 [Polaromonas sp.]